MFAGAMSSVGKSVHEAEDNKNDGRTSGPGRVTQGLGLECALKMDKGGCTTENNLQLSPRCLIMFE